MIVYGCLWVGLGTVSDFWFGDGLRIEAHSVKPLGQVSRYRPCFWGLCFSYFKGLSGSVQYGYPIAEECMDFSCDLLDLFLIAMLLYSP